MEGRGLCGLPGRGGGVATTVKQPDPGLCPALSEGKLQVGCLSGSPSCCFPALGLRISSFRLAFFEFPSWLLHAPGPPSLEGTGFVTGSRLATQGCSWLLLLLLYPLRVFSALEPEIDSALEQNSKPCWVDLCSCALAKRALTVKAPDAALKMRWAGGVGVGECVRARVCVLC